MNQLSQELIKFCCTYSELLPKELEGKSISVDKNSMLITALWLRIVENYEGIIAVSSARASVNTFLILRSMVEAFLIMKQCILDKEFHLVYMNKHLQEKTGRIIRLIKSEKNTGFKMSKSELRDLEVHFNRQFSNDVSKKVSTYKLAKDLNEIPLFEMVYSHCNIFVHCDLASLTRHFSETNNELKLTTNNKIDEDIVLSCSMGSSLFLKAFEEFSRFINHSPIHTHRFINEYNHLQDLIERKLFK